SATISIYHLLSSNSPKFAEFPALHFCFDLEVFLHFVVAFPLLWAPFRAISALYFRDCSFPISSKYHSKCFHYFLVAPGRIEGIIGRKSRAFDRPKEGQKPR